MQNFCFRLDRLDHFKWSIVTNHIGQMSHKRINNDKKQSVRQVMDGFFYYICKTKARYQF